MKSNIWSDDLSKTVHQAVAYRNLDSQNASISKFEHEKLKSLVTNPKKFSTLGYWAH